MKTSPSSKIRSTFMVAFALAALCFILDFITGTPCLANVSGSGISVAGIIGLANIDDVNDRQTSGSEIAYELYLVEVHQLDLDHYNLKLKIDDADGKRGTEGKPFLATAQSPMRMEAHDIPTLLSSIEKGDITTTGSNTFTVVLANSNRDEVANFVERQQGARFLLFYHHIESETWYVLGTKDRPITLSTAEVKDDKDGRYATCTFKRNSVDLPYPYTGNIPADLRPYNAETDAQS